MPSVSDPDLFSTVARSILDGVAAALDACGLDIPPCDFVGFSRPAETSCPDLVAWVTNIRAWDGNTMDSGLQEGRLLCFNAYAFDVTIRLGQCFVDFDDNGNNLPPEIQEDFSSTMYRYAQAMYIGFVAQWRAGNISSLGNCDPITVSSLIDYKEGGCGGWEYTVTVGVM